MYDILVSKFYQMTCQFFFETSEQPFSALPLNFLSKKAKTWKDNNLDV